MVRFTDEMARRLSQVVHEKIDTRLPAVYAKLSAVARIAIREQYIENQRGLCWFCKADLHGPPTSEILVLKINWHAFPGREPGFTKHPIHLHHDHDTGLTVGAVHAQCNAVLWQYLGL